MKVEVSGPRELVAMDNGYPADITSFQSNERHAFSGLLLAIVRVKAEMSGLIKVTAKSSNLAATEITIKSR